MDLYDGLGMLNSSIQFAGAQIGAVKDKKFIREENEKARQFQLDMWNKMNEYNMPSAVLGRYEQAGIKVNPNYLVTGKYDGGLASLASSPGHSAPNMNSKDISKNLNFLGALQQSQQMKLQKQLVESQIEVNDSVISKNIANAEESRSQIPFHLANKHLTDAIKGAYDLDNAFKELTFQTRNEIMLFDAALKEQNISLVRSQIRNIDASTDNNNKLTDMRMTVMAESLAMAWKQIELSERELVGKLELWAKTGDAAQLNAKANFLNSLTNSKLYDLKKDSFDKFSDDQLKLLQENVYKLKTFNGWYDILLENQARYGGFQIDYGNSKKLYQDLQNTFFDMKMFIPLLDF